MPTPADSSPSRRIVRVHRLASPTRAAKAQPPSPLDIPALCGQKLRGLRSQLIDSKGAAGAPGFLLQPGATRPLLQFIARQVPSPVVLPPGAAPAASDAFEGVLRDLRGLRAALRRLEPPPAFAVAYQAARTQVDDDLAAMEHIVAQAGGPAEGESAEIDALWEVVRGGEALGEKELENGAVRACAAWQRSLHTPDGWVDTGQCLRLQAVFEDFASQWLDRVCGADDDPRSTARRMAVAANDGLCGAGHRLAEALGGVTMRPEVRAALAKCWVDRSRAALSVGRQDRLARLLDGIVRASQEAASAPSAFVLAVLEALVASAPGRPSRSMLRVLATVLHAVGGANASPANAVPILAALDGLQAGQAHARSA